MCKEEKGHLKTKHCKENLISVLLLVITHPLEATEGHTHMIFQRILKGKYGGIIVVPNFDTLRIKAVLQINVAFYFLSQKTSCLVS